MTKSGKPIQDALKDFIQEQVLVPYIVDLKEQEMSKFVKFEDVESQVNKVKQQTF